MARMRAHVFVSGRVHGVWFRESTRRRASELGVDGWVRNLPDGRVEAIFEGDADSVREAVAFTRVGPRFARVTDVQVEESEALDAPHASGFRVR